MRFALGRSSAAQGELAVVTHACRKHTTTLANVFAGIVTLGENAPVGVPFQNADDLAVNLVILHMR